MCSRLPRHTSWDAPEKPEESFIGQDIAKDRWPMQEARNTRYERRSSIPTRWGAPEKPEKSQAEQETTTDQWSVPQAGNARNEDHLPMPTSWGAPEKPEKPLAGEETATGQRSVPQDRNKRHDFAHSRPEAGAASGGGTNFQQQGGHESPTTTRSNTAGTSQPCSYKDRFVVKKHKPEAPEEQRRVLKNLHRDVLQSIDRILMTIRSRQPRTVADWDHVGSHDEEIETIRDQICDKMSQVFEATTTSQQDHIVELEGLVKEARRQVSNLEKVLADQGLFRQSRAASMAQEEIKPTDDVSTQTSLLPEDADNGHGVNDKPDHDDKAESASMNHSIMSKLDAVWASQKRTEEGMKYLDEVKKELKTTKDELIALLSARSGGDGGDCGESTGGTGRFDGQTGKRGGNQDAHKNAGDSTNASGDIAQEPETPPVTPWGTGHAEEAWGSDDRETPRATSSNPSSSASTGRQSTRRYSASNSENWKVPAVAPTRRTTLASRILKKCLKVDEERGSTRATVEPEGAEVSGSTEPPPAAWSGKSQW